MAKQGKRKAKLLKKLAKADDLMKGSLAQSERSCGRRGCRCQRGKKHKGYFFSYRIKQKAQVIYVPEELYPKVKELNHNWRSLKKIIEALTALNCELVKSRKL